MNHYCTYDPADNKLRLYPSCRLSAETYARLKAAGFKWAPKQELFVAPAWTPAREDLLLELCGEIGDEDTSLVERAEERADRFEDYSDKRADDANRAHAAVSAIADAIPLGQPILRGHHSEKHARKDKERIENGTRKAVKAWKTSQYWLDRAKGALAHAKYKERPDVRHRRIKTLEAELRKCRAAYTPPDDPPHVTMQTPIGSDQAEPHVWVGPKGGRGGQWVRVAVLPAIKASMERWEQHYENRLAYERAMLDEQGGIKADAFDLKVGGQVLTRDLWLTITRVNKSGGAVSSVSTNNRSWPRVVSVEDIKGYRPPTEEAQAKVKAATKLPPLCNYPAEGHVEVTQEKWDRTHRDYKSTKVVEGDDKHGRHRVRYMMVCGYSLSLVYIVDAKRKDPPPPDASKPGPALPPVERDLATAEREAERAKQFRERQANAEASPFARLEDALKDGVQVVVAPQLFPTPPDLAQQVVELANIEAGMTILEPSAGTGALLAAIRQKPLAFMGGLTIVEINRDLCHALTSREGYHVHCRDFLECTTADLGFFDRVVMNPPFGDAADIKHVEHALTFLNPDGRLVAIVANGPRQRAKLMPRATAWIDLPEGSFAEAGTNVNAAICVYDAEGESC